MSRLHNGRAFGYQVVNRLTRRTVAFYDLRWLADRDRSRRGLLASALYTVKLVALPGEGR